MTRTHKVAWITLRVQPPYRSGSFATGFERLGYRPRLEFPPVEKIMKHDVVVTWNLNPRYRSVARAAKEMDAALIVAENGYVKKAGQSDLPVYALARDGHNGSGWWNVGPEDRWASTGRKIHPWRDLPGGYILLCGQRGIGSETMRSPGFFTDHTYRQIQRILSKHKRKDIPILIREHPGRHKPKRSLKEDFEGARCVVSWSSNVINEALLLGIPTFRLAPYHVNEAAATDLNQLLNPPLGDREAAFKKLAWAQWYLPEINDGTSFKWLLKDRIDAD